MDSDRDAGEVSPAEADVRRSRRGRARARSGNRDGLGPATKRARVCGSEASLSIGTITRVTEVGFLYTYYTEMAQRLKLSRWQPPPDSDDDRSHFGDGDKEEDDIVLQKGDIGIVLGMAKHDTDSTLIVGINVARHKRDFLIGARGLEVLCPAAVGPHGQTSTPIALMQHMWTTRASAGDGVLVAAGGHTVPAHSAVLAAASPVFAASFASGMRESQTRRIELPDTAADTVEGTLELLYTGTMPSTLDMRPVLAFAHKYQIIEAARYVAHPVIAAMSLDDAAEAVRMLRDLGNTCYVGTAFVDIIIDVWGDNKPMMREILGRL